MVPHELQCSMPVRRWRFPKAVASMVVVHVVVPSMDNGMYNGGRASRLFHATWRCSMDIVVSLDKQGRTDECKSEIVVDSRRPAPQERNSSRIAHRGGTTALGTACKVMMNNIQQSSGSDMERLKIGDIDSLNFVDILDFGSGSSTTAMPT